MDVFIASLLLLGVPLGYLALQLQLLRRWRGGFRLAAALPLLGWLAWAARLAIDVAADPTSHNLFPFEVLSGALLALAYLVLLSGVRWVLAMIRPP